MKFPYYLYMAICWLTHHFRWIMPFWEYANLNFAIRLLFRDNATSAVVFAQAAFETRTFPNGKPTPFTSNLCVKNKNYFGMGKSNIGYQSSSTSNGVPGEPAYSAKYNSVYQSVYDYYDYTKSSKRNQAAGDFIKTHRPQASFDNKGALFAYITAYVAVLKAHGYFAGDAYQYANAVYHHTVYYKPSLARIVCNFVYAMAIPAFAPWFYRRYLRR